MKKRNFTAILFSLLIAGLAGITGCAETVEAPNDINSISSADNANSPANDPDNTNISEISEPEPQKPELSDEAKVLLSQLKKQSFTAPNGEEILAADAVDITKGSIVPYDGYENAAQHMILDENGELAFDWELIDSVLKYDYAYISYASPYFSSIQNYTGYTDYSIFKETVDPLEEQLEKNRSERKWLKVKAGDKLENGLTVIRAEGEIIPTAKAFFGTRILQLSGDFTMEGMLYYVDNNNHINPELGGVLFFPDPTVTTGVPILSSSRGYTKEWFRRSCVICDGDYIYLGKIDDLDLDMTELFPGAGADVDDDFELAPDYLSRVIITVRDPYFQSGIMDESRGLYFIRDVNIVSIERVDQ